MDIHESPVTACQYYADCQTDLIPALYSVGSSKQKRTGFSEKVWSVFVLALWYLFLLGEFSISGESVLGFSVYCVNGQVWMLCYVFHVKTHQTNLVFIIGFVWVYESVVTEKPWSFSCVVNIFLSTVFFVFFVGGGGLVLNTVWAGYVGVTLQWVG